MTTRAFPLLKHRLNTRHMKFHRVYRRRIRLNNQPLPHHHKFQRQHACHLKIAISRDHCVPVSEFRVFRLASQNSFSVRYDTCKHTLCPLTPRHQCRNSLEGFGTP